MIFDYRIRILREKAEIEQKEFAKILGISNSRYNHYENETDIIPIKYLIVISEFYNVSFDYLFGFNKQKQYSNINNINLKTSGKRIKQLRKDNKLKQKELADILNNSTSSISHYEKGRNLIATPFLYTICSKYHISADYLLGKIDSPKYLNSTKK